MSDIDEYQVYRQGEDVYADCDCGEEADRIGHHLGDKNAHDFYCNACEDTFTLHFDLNQVPEVP